MRELLAPTCIVIAIGMSAFGCVEETDIGESEPVGPSLASLEEAAQSLRPDAWRPWVVSDFDYDLTDDTGFNHCQLGEVRTLEGDETCEVQYRTNGAGTPLDSTCTLEAQLGLAECVEAFFTVTTEGDPPECAGRFIVFEKLDCEPDPDNPEEEVCSPVGEISPLVLSGTNDHDAAPAACDADEDCLFKVEFDLPCDEISTEQAPYLPIGAFWLALFQGGTDWWPVERPLGNIHFDRQWAQYEEPDSPFRNGRCLSLEIPGTRNPAELEVCVDGHTRRVNLGRLERVDPDTGELVRLRYDLLRNLISQGAEYGPCD
jgi:hypothetical protein